MVELVLVVLELGEVENDDKIAYSNGVLVDRLLTWISELNLLSHSEHLRSEKGGRRRNEINVLYGMILQHVESDREANISELLPKEPLKVPLPPLMLLTPPADPAWIAALAPGPISGPKPPTP